MITITLAAGVLLVLIFINTIVNLPNQKKNEGNKKSIANRKPNYETILSKKDNREDVYMKLSMAKAKAKVSVTNISTAKYIPGVKKSKSATKVKNYRNVDPLNDRRTHQFKVRPEAPVHYLLNQQTKV